MSTPPKRRSSKKVKADAGPPMGGAGTPTDVFPGSGYNQDPAVHSTDAQPQQAPALGGPGEQPTPVEDLEENASERNRVLTAPLPLVVSAPEAIEKMETLNKLVQEGRPDLSREAEAVAQALDTMERKALGDQGFATHEAAEGHDPSTGAPQGQPAQAAFAAGDRVVVALDDGDYTGEIQKDNGDGTFDVKTDQMATFRRVPAASIARPEALQPVASKENRKMAKKPPVKKTKASKVAAEPIVVEKPKRTKKTAASKIEADMMEKQALESDGVDVNLADGGSIQEPWGPEQVKDFGEPTIEAMAKFYGMEPSEILGVEKIHGWFGRYSAPGFLDTTDWVFDQDKGSMEAELERLHGIDASKKVKAMKEGYTLVDGVKVVEEAGKPRAFDQDKDDTVPAELYVNPEGKLALMGPDGNANYEDAANDEVELAYWKAVHTLVPAAEAPAEDKDAKAAENVAKWADKAGVKAGAVCQSCNSKPAQEGKEYCEACQLDAGVEASAKEIIAEHKVQAEQFHMVLKVAAGAEVRPMDAAGIRKALKDGLAKADVLGLFDDKGAADRFAKIAGGNSTAQDELNQAAEELENADSAVAMAELDMEDAPPMAKDAAEAGARSAREAAEHFDRAAENIENVVASGARKDLAKDPTFAAALAGLKGSAEDAIEIVAGKDGSITARLKPKASFKEEVFQDLREMAKLDHPGAKAVLEKAEREPGFFDEQLADLEAGAASVEDASGLLMDLSLVLGSDLKAGSVVIYVDPETGKKKWRHKTVEEGGFEPIVEVPAGGSAEAEPKGPEVEASAFDEIPELEIGGGMKARRKKGGDGKDGKDKAKKIEVVDKDGKVVAEYPDAFGDDTVVIIQFLRQVLDIKEADDKKAAKGKDGADDKDKGGDKGGKKDEKGGSAEDKPVALPDAKPDKKDSAAPEDKGGEKDKELEARAKWMEERVTACRHIVEAMVRKGHVVASQEDIDAELLKGKTLKEAQVAASRKAIDGEVMKMLAKPEAELQVIKASLSLLKERQVTVKASEGHIDLAHIAAAGLIEPSGASRTSQLGIALSSAFNR